MKHFYISKFYLLFSENVTNKILTNFIFSLVLKWLQHQKASLITAGVSDEDVKLHMDELVYATLSLIRYPMMSPRQLAELCLNPLMQSYKEFFLDRMAIGMNFHNGNYGTHLYLSLRLLDISNLKSQDYLDFHI